MRSFIILATSLAIVGCASKPVNMEPIISPGDTAKQEQPQKPAASAQRAKDPETATSTVVKQPLQTNPLKDPNNILYQRSVYFDFDRYEIKPQYQELVKSHAKYLIEHPHEKTTLQGNADERGSREYNLALGQKRAVAVKKVMNLYGVEDKQIETVSFGEEKPRVESHDEMAWAENRRTDIVYPGD